MLKKVADRYFGCLTTILLTLLVDLSVLLLLLRLIGIESLDWRWLLAIGSLSFFALARIVLSTFD